MAILIAGSLKFSVGSAPAPEWEILGLHISVAAVIQTFIVVTVLLFVGEIIPKVYATKNRLAVAPALSPLIHFLNRMLKPVSFLLISMSRIIDRNIALSQDNPSLQELRHAIDLTTANHNSHHAANEKQLLKGIVSFSQISVRSVMKSRVDVIALERGSSFEEVMAIINEHGFSRMPVYEENLDTIVGILHIKDLLPLLSETAPTIHWDTVLREPYFVPESKKLDSLLDELKRKHLHIAVVVDEFGGTAGIVTLEDVMEEILGDISDEFDSDSLTYTKKSDNEYIFEGRAPLNDLRRVLHLPDATFEDARGDNDTLGGLLLELHGKIPKRGDSISYQRYTFHIEAASENRIHQVRMVIS
jgi:gliding motility-associated protein GldE